MKLICHCDHCINNTCIAHEYGSCLTQLTLSKDGYSIDKKFSCLEDHRPLQHIICNSTSYQAVVRCCNSENHCNQRENFYPSDEEARKLFIDGSPNINDTSLQLPTPDHPKNPTTQRPPLINIEYSGLNFEFLLVIILFFGLLLIIIIALYQKGFVGKKLKRRKLRTNNNDNHHDSPHKVAITDGTSDNKNGVRRNGAGFVVVTDEDHSENSSCKANPDAIVYDTNSMASREPLLNHASSTNNSTTNHANGIGGHNPLANSLPHPSPMRGPWMQPVDDSVTGKTTSCTFQMTIGSGDPQKKPETSSGSGQGQPYLTQRSIAHDIELIEVVGRGYFGVVWRGQYKSEPVAVKIFSQKAEPSWQREAEIYQTTMLRHKNILGFIATDKRADASMTGYWLITDYYPMGSLFDFLKKQSLSMPDSLRMAFSIANGLAHLHIEIFGTHGKPAIAHRDLKSKNVLVKNDGTCCIADLGMAVRYNSNTGVVDVPTNTRVGTRRYLAPEILEGKFNLMNFEAVKATDIYALGLVLWEILRRTIETSPDDPSIGLTAVCDPYEAPYQEFVQGDPTTEEMYRIVCEQKIRPPISVRWTKFEPMKEYTALMRECWYEKPQARLSALRIRKTLGDIARRYFNFSMEYD